MTRIVQEDDRGWLWVLATSRTAAGTELDVFDGTEYQGSVALRDHVLGIRIIGDTLLVLAEVDDPDRVVPTRRLDWYEIVRRLPGCHRSLESLAWNPPRGAGGPCTRPLARRRSTAQRSGTSAGHG